MTRESAVQSQWLSLIDSRAIVCALKHATHANNWTRTGASVAVAAHAKAAGGLFPAHSNGCRKSRSWA